MSVDERRGLSAASQGESDARRVLELGTPARGASKWRRLRNGLRPRRVEEAKVPQCIWLIAKGPVSIPRKQDAEFALSGMSVMSCSAFLHASHGLGFRAHVV